MKKGAKWLDSLSSNATVTHCFIGMALSLFHALKQAKETSLCHIFAAGRAPISGRLLLEQQWSVITDFLNGDGAIIVIR